jgi:phage gpG-like protein
VSSYKDNSRAFLDDLAKAVDFGLGGVADIGARAAARSMPGVGAKGIQTRRGRLRYKPSDPGNPPGVRTNRLRASVTSQRIKYAESWGYGTNVKYGRAHELGRPGILPPRPFLRPALEQTRGGMQREFVKQARRSLQRSVTARAVGGA